MIRTCLTTIACVLLLGITRECAAVDIPVSCFGTFLRVDPVDSATLPTRIRLADYGITPGTILRLQALGDYDNGPGGDEFFAQLAIFTSDTQLLATNLQARVPGALDCGRHGTSGLTCPSGLPTDIAEDFYIMADSTNVIVPPGAVYLLVIAAECYFQDNSDPDHDFAVRLTPLGLAGVEPGRGPALALAAPWPNPATRTARFTFTLGDAGETAAHVYAVDGRLVRTLFAGRAESGAHEVAWDLRDGRGVPAAAGVYFVQLETAGKTLRRRLVVTR